jgi:ubiquinol-cytochrome c reductase cytochrome c1 subunit
MIRFKFFLLALCSISAIAASSSIVRLEKFNPTVRQDQATLVRGGKFFAKRCMSCHSLKLFTYDEIGELAGVTPEKMPKLDLSSWGGHPPPDLSLVTRYRGVDWLYTYLQSFYIDESQSLGVNNLVMPAASMPNPFLDLQGEQVLSISKQELLDIENSQENLLPWYRLLKLKKQGNITHAEFNSQIESLVLFLEYVGEPSKAKRLAIAPLVLLFLVLFFIIMLLLKKDIWKNID